MSARKRRLALSADSERDFRNLLAYTESQWGKAQRRVYRKLFIDAFAELARFPDLGPTRPELGQRVRVYRVGQHVVLYQPSDTEVLIVRILHVRRDFNAELG